MSETTGDGDRTLRRTFGIPQLVLLAALGGIGPLGTDTYLASMPAVAHDFGATAATVQLTLSGFMAGLALGQIILGPLSDRLGRYRLLVAGVLVMVLSSALCALAPSVGTLIAARIVQGLSGAAALVLSRSIVADLAHGSAAARAFNVLGMITGVTPVIAPVIGGLIQKWSVWQTVFWVLTAVSLVLLVGTLLLVRESLPPARRRPGGVASTLRTAAGILADRQFLGYGLGVWFGFGAMFGYISASPFVIQEMLGFGPLVYTLIFAVNACGISATSAISAALARTVGPAPLIPIGVAAQLVGALGIGGIVVTGAISAWTVLPAFFLIATGMGLVFGNGTALAIEPMAHAHGTALAVLGCLQFAMAGVVAPLVGIAGAHSMVPLAIVTIVCSIVAAFGVSLGRRALRARAAGS